MWVGVCVGYVKGRERGTQWWCLCYVKGRESVIMGGYAYMLCERKRDSVCGCVCKLCEKGVSGCADFVKGKEISSGCVCRLCEWK